MRHRTPLLLLATLSWACGPQVEAWCFLEGTVGARNDSVVSGLQLRSIDRNDEVLAETVTAEDGDYELSTLCDAYTALVVSSLDLADTPGGEVPGGDDSLSPIPTGFVVYARAMEPWDADLWIYSQAEFHHEYHQRLADCPQQRPSVHSFDAKVSTPITYPTDTVDHETRRVAAWYVEVHDQPDAEICTATETSGGEEPTSLFLSSSITGLRPGFVETTMQTEDGLEEDFLLYAPPDGIAAVATAMFMEER